MYFIVHAGELVATVHVWHEIFEQVETIIMMWYGRNLHSLNCMFEGA